MAATRVRRTPRVYPRTRTHVSSARRGYVRLSQRESRARGACVRMLRQKKNTACAILAVARAHRYIRAAGRRSCLPLRFYASQRGRQKKRWLRNGECSFSFLFTFAFAAASSNPAVRRDDAKHRIRLRHAFAHRGCEMYFSFFFFLSIACR